MKRLVKNGEIILDGTLNRAEKEKEILEKFEKHEELEEELGIDLYKIFKDRQLYVLDEETNEKVLVDIIRIELDSEMLYLAPIDRPLWKTYYRSFTRHKESWWYLDEIH